MTLRSIFDGHLARVNRAKVWGACYRLTGCAADADEVVQEAFARALETRPSVSDEAPLEPWVLTVAVRLAVDRLRRRREQPYDGPWLPSPVDVGDAEERSSPAARYALIESATFAFLLALEALSPTQRAVVVLRDVMDLSASETATVLDETEANVRVLHHRARAKLEAYDREAFRFDAAARDRARIVLETLFGHLVAGDARAAMDLLADGVRLVNDAGGAFHAARRVVTGADRVVRFYLGVMQKVGMPDEVRVRVMNGLPAIEMFYARNVGRYAPHLVTGVMLDDAGRVAQVYSVLAPRKLVHLRDLQTAG